LIVCKDCSGPASQREKRVMSTEKIAMWLVHQGYSAMGPCHACCDTSRLISIVGKYDNGHDKAHAKGGTTSASNMFPTHPECNGKMGQSSFDAYRKSINTDGELVFPPPSEIGESLAIKIANHLRRPAKVYKQIRPSVMKVRPTSKIQTTMPQHSSFSSSPPSSSSQQPQNIP